MTVDTSSIIRDARAELKDRVSVREGIDKRIAELRVLLRGLVRFVPDDANRQAVLAEVENARRKAPSLKDAVLEAVMHSKNGLTSTEVREVLEQSGFDLDEYSQPLGAIMTVLKRLCDGENPRLRREAKKDKTIVFRFMGLPSVKGFERS